MNPVIYARANFPPFRRLGRLMTADDIDSASILMGEGKAVFRVAQNDPCFGLPMEVPPACYWRMGEAAGNLADSSGNANTATAHGAPTYSVTGAIPGDSNTAISLPGNGANYFEVANSPSVDTGDTFSIVAWIKKAVNNAAMAIVSRPGDGYDFRFTAANKLNLTKCFVSSIVDSTVTVDDTDWHLVAVTKAGATVHLYIDGADVTGTVTNAAIVANAGVIHIGRNAQDGGVPWNGSLDELMIFSTALTADQIMGLYMAALSGEIATVYQLGPNLIERGKVVEISDKPAISYSLKNNAGTLAATGVRSYLIFELQQAQSFRTPSMGQGELSAVSLPLAKTGLPTGNLSVTIRADDGSNKPGAVLGTADTLLDVSTLTGDAVWHTFVFSPTIPLEPETLYHIAWDSTGLVHDDTKYAKWFYYSAATELPGCNWSADGGTIWTLVPTGELGLILILNWFRVPTRQTPPWIGYVERPLFDHSSGTVEVECIDVQGMLAKRHAGVQASRSGAAGLIARDLLFQANARNPFGLWWDPASEAGSPVVDIDVGGSSLLDALNKLAEATGDEWYVYCVAGPDRLEMYLRWCAKRGLDLSQTVYLREGYEISSIVYSQDALEEAESVMMVGGGGLVEDRPTVIRASGGQARVSEAGALVQGASESYRRAVALAPALADERVVVDPRQTDVAVLASSAQRVLETPLYAAEGLQLTVNSRVDWSLLDVGNTVRAKLENTPWGVLDRRIRILETQQCSDGLLRLEVKVLRE